jgi:diphosphomevalonate decarboxylase
VKISASAPSNIALIKYMGKTSSSSNLPANSSLSYTLTNLRSFVEITPHEAASDSWELLTGPNLLPFEMSENGQARYLRHFGFLKRELGIEGNFLIRSANNFPSDCGLASSASSFAALTLAVARLAEEQEQDARDLFELADLSRRGSGSSCRSFFGPWVLWDTSGVRPLEFSMGPLQHAVIVVESKKKSVSSSEAHQRVATSSLFQNRPQRAEERLAKLLVALRHADWKGAFELTWAEFWDMHALFETSKPPFGYFEAGTFEVLSSLRHLWNETGDGPLVTMDAGANIHLLFREDQTTLVSHLKSEWSSRFRFLLSSEYAGA